MDGANMTQEQANAVIYELSKNSAFFKNAKARDAKLNARIEKLRKRLPTARPVSSPFMARLVARLEAQRNLDRVWCVVDMDMFYAAVAMRDDPSLRGKPIAIGGMGMLSTANYEARKYRVRSAMPGFIAKRLCPHLILVKSDWAAYRVAAQQTRDVFREYDPNFTAGSLDEASLDITEYLLRKQQKLQQSQEKANSHSSSRRRSLLLETQPPDDASSSSDSDNDTPQKTTTTTAAAAAAAAAAARSELFALADTVVAEIREKCRRATNGLTCSAGIGPNRMLAKIASDANKPNGQCNVGHTAQAVVRFMRELPVRKVPGVGKVTERILKELLGVTTCGELFAARDRVATPGLFKEHTRDWLLKCSVGIASSVREDPGGARAVGPKRKGISKEATFHAVSKSADLIQICRQIADGLAEDMAREELKARTVTLKLKTTDFEVMTRAKSLSAGTFIWQADDIFNVAKSLLMKEHRESLRGRGLRLLGIRCSAFRGAANDLEKGQTKLTFGAAGVAAGAAGAAGGAVGAASPSRPPNKLGVRQTIKTATRTHEQMQAQALRAGIVDEAVLSELPADIRAELKRTLPSASASASTSASTSAAAASSPIMSSLRQAGVGAAMAKKGGGLLTMKRPREALETGGSPKDQAWALRTGNIDAAFLAELPPDIRKELENSLRLPPRKRTKKKEKRRRGKISSFFARRE
jgi:DNA polymerase kappa